MTFIDLLGKCSTNTVKLRKGGKEPAQRKQGKGCGPKLPRQSIQLQSKEYTQIRYGESNIK